MKRSCLKFGNWPVQDQTMWTRLVSAGDILDGAGAGARWRPATQSRFQRDYGYWLSFRMGIGPGLDLDPTARASPDLVRSYVQSMDDLSSTTRAMRVEGLSIVLRSAAPSADLNWLREMEVRLIAAAKREPKPRKQGRIVSTDKLVALGRDLMRKATETPLEFSRAVLFRDGLMIALLALRPLRISNFAGLRLGVQLMQTSSGYWINIPPEQTKSGRPLEMPVPDVLIQYLCDYLERHRPVLVRDRQTDYLWINEWGRPFKPERLSQRISGLTERHLGIRVTPHLFRDCAATTTATLDPEHVRVIMPLLGHSDPRTAEDHYNYATTLEVGRELQAIIRQIRAEGAPLRYRRPRQGL